MNEPVQNSPLSVGYTVRDMKKSLAFYRDLLGFEMKECWPSADEPWWCSLQRDGQTIMLGADMGAGGDESCGGMTGADVDWHKSGTETWRKGIVGAGVNLYVLVDDVDAYHAQVTKKGGEPRYEPKTQFYGIRDFGIEDPDGYRLIFYTPVTMESCQSCAMPLTDAQPGQMYCQYCTDDHGQLRPYEQVFEGTVTGFFMGMQKMDRKAAEAAAKEHLAKMPAWVSRS